MIHTMKSFSLLLVGTLCVMGCQSQGMPAMPWQSQNNHPPVELLEDDPQIGEDAATQQPEDGLSMASTQRFSDVPLPEGARPDNDRSYVYEDSKLEIGRMVYTSKASINDLAQFYIRECQEAGWELERLTEAEGAHLHFSKPDRRLEVLVRSLGVGRSQELILHLTPNRQELN